ncbi:hypothetical protein E2C01_009869 [Portunus trituberculatus]|uniref:Uncharacterized protein n=1 Tax=Portunus trituberculatus TaxID=210409 RepID=A0A5B7D6X2_PORTR|nr:hypothetical protein [Portunus trituberculatus]
MKINLLGITKLQYVEILPLTSPAFTTLRSVTGNAYHAAKDSHQNSSHWSTLDSAPPREMALQLTPSVRDGARHCLCYWS